MDETQFRDLEHFTCAFCSISSQFVFWFWFHFSSLVFLWVTLFVCERIDLHFFVHLHTYYIHGLQHFCEPQRNERCPSDYPPEWQTMSRTGKKTEKKPTKALKTYGARTHTHTGFAIIHFTFSVRSFTLTYDKWKTFMQRLATEHFRCLCTASFPFRSLYTRRTAEF